MHDPTSFENFLEIDLNNDIGMYYCGRRIHTLNHTYGPEIRNHYLFVLVDKGFAEKYDDTNTHFGEHDLLVMCPNTRIHYKALTPWSISWLGLYGETVKEYMDLLGVTPQNPILHISLYNELKTVMDRIYAVSDNTTFSAKLHIAGLVYEFFSVLMSNSTVNQKTNLTDSALRIIDYSFCENISVNQIAARLNIDPAYFSRKFAEDIGIGPKKYILQKRIERAKELLHTTDASVFEISNSVGYSDQFYFCRIFKKIVGISPSQFQKQKQ